MDSNYWNSKMNEYSEKIKEIREEKKDYDELNYQLISLFASINRCAGVLNNSSKGLEKIIINGKTYDDGKIKEYASKLISDGSGIQTLRRECSEKIQKLDDELKFLTRLYDKAKANRDAALASENNQSQTTNTPSSSSSNSSRKVGRGNLQIKKMTK